MPESKYQQSLLRNYARNKAWAKKGNYFTKLSPEQELAFRSWVAKNKVPFNPNAPVTDYDMRGYWMSLLHGGNPGTAINPYDHKLHFPDTYKTPYDKTFSNQSIYALPDAPRWKGNRYLIAPDGSVLFDATKDTGG